MHSAARYLLLAGSTLVAAQAGSSEVNCITAVGPKPVSAVGTTTVESTSTVSIADATTTAVVVETLTAIAVTETDTTTVEVTTTTTEDTVTDTYTSTSTEIDTATTTITQTETTTTTASETETTTATSVIAAPSGFVPIADTQNGYPARKRDSHRRHCHKPVAKPSVYPTPIVGTYGATPVSSSSASSSPSTSGTPCSLGDGTQYPTSVECSATTTTQQTVTATSTSSTTITPAPVTTTTTSTVTSTSTEVPRASTTLTTTETSTTTSTATATTTTTETTTETSTQTATATSYAACQANNILTNYNGASIVNVYNRGQGAATIYDYTEAATPEDCCIACVNKAGCTGSIWRPGNTYCLLMYADGRTCARQSDNAAQFVTSSGSSSGFVLSNGLCGYQEWLAGN